MIKVVIRGKDTLLFSGEVESVTSTNELGVFDILPRHAHFIGLVREYVIVRVNKKEQKWPIDRGILAVNDDAVEVYIGY